MATMSAMLKLFGSCDSMTDKMFSASGATDKLKEKLESIKATAISASTGLGKLIDFTELMQKSLKVGDASGYGQQDGMYQSTPDMAVGDYINAKLETLPVEFDGVWNNVLNGGLNAFNTINEKVNELAASEGLNNFINGVFAGLDLIADKANWVKGTIDLVSGAADWTLETLDSFEKIFISIDEISKKMKHVWNMASPMAKKFWTMVSPVVAQAKAWLAVNWPILAVVAVIGILVAALLHFGVTGEQIVGFVAGIFGIAFTQIANCFIYFWNMVAAFVNFFGNAFNNPIASIKVLFYDLAINVLGFIEKMASGIGTLINKITGIEVDITAGITGLKNKLANDAANIRSEEGLVEYAKSKDFMDYSEGYTKGSKIGTKAYNSIAGASGSLVEQFPDDGLGTTGNPMAVQGTGNNGSLDVAMPDEDLQYLRDVAERDYVNKFSTATLSPNISVSFGDVHKEADADKVAGRIQRILQEEIAVAAEGSYD